MLNSPELREKNRKEQRVQFIQDCVFEVVIIALLTIVFFIVSIV